jgi:4-hydroxy-tetrahydrodipicolinate reductase
MNPIVPIAVYGAAGRMGQAVLRLALEEPRVAVVAAIVKAGSANAGGSWRDTLGDGARDLAYSAHLDAAVAPAVLVDFSAADAFDDALAIALARRIAFVSGTTGLSAQQDAALREAAKTIPVLWSANFSIGVAVLDRLVREAARVLSDWDCEIAESHHRHKKDAPSGTALALGRAVAEARGVDFERATQGERAAPRARDASATADASSMIGFASVRAGDIVGEHTVLFAGAGERIELTHRATDRTIFARGALRAAAWIAARRPGFHTLADVLDHRAG